MVSYLASIAVATSLLAALPQGAAPQWESDYGKALKATRADDQPLLVVLEEPTAGSEIQQVTYTEETPSAEQAELLTPYQLCKVDVSTEYGKQVAEAFGATKFPYTAIIDKSGSVILFSKTGQLSSNELSETLTTYKTGERELAMASHSSEPTETVVFRKSYESTNSSYCPSCQRGY